MGTTVYGFTFYEKQVETGIYLGQTQAQVGFNAEGGDTIRFAPSGARKGRKPSETVMTPVSGLIQRRDPTSTTDITPVNLGNAEHVAIKLFRTAQAVFARQDWIDQGMTTAEGQRLYGQLVGEDMMLNALNSALAAIVGSIQAIGGSGTAWYDYSGTGTLTAAALNSGRALLGDRYGMARSLVTRGKVMHDFIGQGATSTSVAYQLGGAADTATIYSGSIGTMQLIPVVTDAAPLFIDNSGTDHYWTAVLVPGAITIRMGESAFDFSRVTGTAAASPPNLTYNLTTEYEFEIVIKGVKFTGSDNPNDAALATSSNWSLIGSNVKHGPGILIKSQ